MAAKPMSNILLLLVLVLHVAIILWIGIDSAVAFSYFISPNSISTASYISWPITVSDDGDPSSTSGSYTTTRHSYRIEPRSITYDKCMTFLSNHIMAFDRPNKDSLGFHSSSSSSYLPDGLTSGLAQPTISLSLDTKNYTWTTHIPEPIFYEYVLNFANVNEPRTNWRPLFVQTLQPLLASLMEQNPTVEHVIQEINQFLWSALSNKEQQSIQFQSGQTPLIMDPMSILAYGYASCTGLSILLVNALRAAGIPARLAGTSAWNGNPENGNHSWIEFYGSDHKWHIMESLPASGSTSPNLLDPCQWWFCNPEKIHGTSFSAAKLVWNSSSKQHFPMAWDPSNHMVPGEDRTDFMNELCSEC